MKKEMIRDHSTAPREREEQRSGEQPVKAPQARNSVGDIHRAIGNQAVQRLLAQRSGQGPTEVDEQVADRIQRERGGGQPLEGGVQEQMGQAMGQDFRDVRTHTSPEADALSQELGAKAFTVGQDVFFRQGAYDPGSGAGKELIAHELTHVVQQGSGQVHGGPGMTLNAPGDVHEQQADAAARAVTSGTPQRQEEDQVQAQVPEEEEELAQAQVPEEEEELA
ncbi:MAG: DUF4157 domain-containing protein, partial [Anaerolineae bacterium]|nr:DUF4157 domain-containing protein [Anaerolineae bacterium]